MIRRMKNIFEGWTFYESAFDTEKGTLVRAVEVPDARSYGSFLRDHPSYYKQGVDLDALWEKQFGAHGSRRSAFSPVPETIDVQITNYCTVGCPTCYQGSTGKDKHPKALNLVKHLLDGLDQVPYQIAYGGGEPCQLPGFTKVLELTHQRGVVPNFTTSGVVLDPEIGSCARDLCGGVALTYHYWRGRKKFEEAYSWWKEQLQGKQLNVHIIADKDVLPALKDLAEIDPKAQLVLLAYYPDVGRASLDALMPHTVYRSVLPQRLIELRAAGMQIAFSEGLLPWVLSHPEMGLATAFAGRQEGHFSCYVDAQGRVSESSFKKPYQKDVTIHKTRLQDLWNKGWWSRNEPNAPSCYGCANMQKCSSPSDYHALLCEYQPHNANVEPPHSREKKIENLRDKMYDVRSEKGDKALTKEEQDAIAMKMYGVKANEILGREEDI